MDVLRRGKSLPSRILRKTHSLYRVSNAVEWNAEITERMISGNVPCMDAQRVERVGDGRWAEVVRFGTRSLSSTAHPTPYAPDRGGYDDDDDHSRPTTPWVRSVISGVDLMRNAKVGCLQSLWLMAYQHCRQVST